MLNSVYRTYPTRSRFLTLPKLGLSSLRPPIPVNLQGWRWTKLEKVNREPFPHERLHLLKLSLVVTLSLNPWRPCIREWNEKAGYTLEASPDGRPLTEKQRCSGSYRRAVSFQVFKDDSISQRPSLRRLRSRSTVHARRNLPVKEFCYLRTVNLTAAMW